MKMTLNPTYDQVAQKQRFLLKAFFIDMESSLAITSEYRRPYQIGTQLQVFFFFDDRQIVMGGFWDVPGALGFVQLRKRDGRQLMIVMVLKLLMFW